MNRNDEDGCTPGLAAYARDVTKYLVAKSEEQVPVPELGEVCRMCALEIYTRLCHLMQHATEDVSMIAIQTFEDREEMFSAGEEAKPASKRELQS